MHPHDWQLSIPCCGDHCTAAADGGDSVWQCVNDTFVSFPPKVLMFEKMNKNKCVDIIVSFLSVLG